MDEIMLFVAPIIVLLVAVVILPARIRKSKPRKFNKIDTDTSESSYAINEFGVLERIKKMNSPDQTEMEL